MTFGPFNMAGPQSHLPARGDGPGPRLGPSVIHRNEDRFCWLPRHHLRQQGPAAKSVAMLLLVTPGPGSILSRLRQKEDCEEERPQATSKNLDNGHCVTTVACTWSVSLRSCVERCQEAAGNVELKKVLFLLVFMKRPRGIHRGSPCKKVLLVNVNATGVRVRCPQVYDSMSKHGGGL